MRYHGLTPVAVDYHCFAVDEFAFANRRETPDELPIAYSSHRMMTVAVEHHCFAVDTFAFVNHRETGTQFPSPNSSPKRAPMNRPALCLFIILENRRAVTPANQRLFTN